MKIRLYNTPNSWWYVGINYMKGKWISLSLLTKIIVVFWHNKKESECVQQVPFEERKCEICSIGLCKNRKPYKK